MKGIVTSLWITREGHLKVTITIQNGIDKLSEETLRILEKEYENTWLNETAEIELVKQ